MRLVKHSQDTSARQRWQLWLWHERVPAVGTAGRRSQLEAAPGAAAAAQGSGLSESCRAQQNNGNPARLGIVCRGTWADWGHPSHPAAGAGDPWSPGLQTPLPPVREGQQSVLHSHRGCTRDFPWQNSAGFTPKAKYQGYYTADLCSYNKRKIASPLLGPNGILTWYVRKTSELLAITNVSVQHR